jgi:hypothetical protein
MSLLTINEGKTEIDREIIKKVISLVDWQLEARKLHDPIDADSNIAKLEERIRRVLRSGPKTERELKLSAHAHRSGLWNYEQARKNLEHSEEIFWDRGLKKWKLI